MGLSLKQIVWAVVTADKTTNSTAAPPTVVLLTTNVTIASTKSVVLVHFDVSFDNSVQASTSRFYLYFANTLVKGRKYPTSVQLTVPTPGAFSYKTTGLTAGSTAFEIRWQTDGGTINCSASTKGSTRGASLVIKEFA